MKTINIWQPWVRFWATDKSLSALLAMLILFGLVLPALNVSGRILPDIVFSLLLLSGIATLWAENRWIFRIVAAIAIVALLIRWLVRFAPTGTLSSWDAAADMIALALLSAVVLAKVLRSGTITAQRIQGAVAVYLLFGLVWANAYEWTNLVHHNAFTGATDASWTYYSYVTLTTMGYGDITPKCPLARSLATAEALTGQLYIAILISRLVALEVASKQKS